MRGRAESGDVQLFGQFILLGGESVNDTFTLSGKATSGAVKRRSKLYLEGY